jgi:transcription antitermination factor NusG
MSNWKKEFNDGVAEFRAQKARSSKSVLSAKMAVRYICIPGAKTNSQQCRENAKMSFWSVAQTEPLRERLAETELQKNGFVVYCPRIRFRHNGRWRITALFPSYLFLQIAEQWYRARWCCGVIRLLGSDGAPPAQLHENVVAEIRAREKNGFVVLKRKPTKLQKGRQVRIIGGRLDGQLALFENQTKHERIRVLMQILGGFSIVELGQYDYVEALDIAIRQQA